LSARSTAAWLGDPFVDVGTTIKKGQVLCVIEAMKLMNEIDAEVTAKCHVYAENGQPVQHGERLFAIRTTMFKKISSRPREVGSPHHFCVESSASGQLPGLE
jgi:hypothetical protein